MSNKLNHTFLKLLGNNLYETFLMQKQPYSGESVVNLAQDVVFKKNISCSKPAVSHEKKILDDNLVLLMFIASCCSEV